MTRVTLDGEKYYPCELMLESDGLPKYWNGFVCPLFTKEVAEEILDDYYIAWFEDDGIYTCVADANDSPEFHDVWKPVDCTGAYAIGACSWVWQAEEGVNV